MTRHVLMVDDDEEMCEEMSEILRGEGYAVTTAFDGIDGQRLIEKNDYDIILLDMKMPGLEGYDVLRNVKAKKPHLKIIVLTGKPLAKDGFKNEPSVIEDDKKAHLLQLANAVMNKPFDVEKVLGKIRELTTEQA